MRGGAGERLRQFFSDAFQAMMKLTHFVIRLLPIGVFGLMARAIGDMGFGVFAQVGLYMVTVAIGLTLHLLVVLPLLFWLLTRRNPLDHFRAMRGAMAAAFATSSSQATLPLTMTSVEENAGVSNKVASFVLPMGATVNMDGTALLECAGVMFIAQALGADLSIPQQFVVVITALLASIGAAAIPSAGLVMIFVVIEAVGLSGPAAFALVGLMLSVDRPLDMYRTVVNITSDSIGAAVIAHSEGETLDYTNT
jgi:Na+/H+-dicarboxylate symporter